MQFTKCFVAIAALASAVVAVDWAAPEAVKCAQDNWPAIKQQGDSMMGLAKSLLGDDYAKLQELFGTAEGEDLVLPETITDEQLKQMSEILDPQIMDMVAGKPVEDCLKTAAPAEPEPTTSDDGPAEPEPTTSDDAAEPEPTTSDDGAAEPEPEPPVSQPPKCAPKSA